MALVGWVKIHRIAGCISSGSWLLAAASRRAPDSRGLLGGSNARALGNQNWGVSCRRWDDLLISKGAILLNQQFRMMQLPIIINDILHANLQVLVWLQMARHEMPPAISPFDSSFQTEPRAQAPSPSPSHAWALDGGTKEFKDA